MVNNGGVPHTVHVRCGHSLKGGGGGEGTRRHTRCTCSPRGKPLPPPPHTPPLWSVGLWQGRSCSLCHPHFSRVDCRSHCAAMPREQVRAQTAAAPASDVTPRPTPKKPAAAGPRMPWWLVVLGLMYVYRWYAAPVDGCGHGDPLVRELPRFDNVPLNDLLDSVVGETTGGGLRRLGLIDMQRSHLHADVFRNTRGFVMAFNREGAEDAFAGTPACPHSATRVGGPREARS